MARVPIFLHAPQPPAPQSTAHGRDHLSGQHSWFITQTLDDTRIWKMARSLDINRTRIHVEELITPRVLPVAMKIAISAT
jgi:hypothetical protein